MYKIGAGIHRNLYELNILQKVRLPVPLIGVGNLSFGGSGKTLIVQTIAEKLMADGKRVGVVCRSYGAEPGPHILSADNCDPYVVGDEAAMLWGDGRRMAVASGMDKTIAAQMLVERHPDLDIILVDDAFQHHRLHQDLRIIIWPNPGATLRDFHSAADRADILLVPNGLRSPRPEDRTLYFVKEIVGMEGLKKSGEVLPPSTIPPSILVMAGLGPESNFFEHVRNWLGGKGEGARQMCLPDHVDYRRPDVQAKLLSAAAGCDAVLTTAKDAVKLARPCLPAGRLAIPLPPIYVVRVRIRFLTNELLLWNGISDVVKDRSGPDGRG